MSSGQQLFFEGDALYRDMLDGIAGASERVWMESYIFSADSTGQRFAEALMRAAGRGLDVRLHVDAAGMLFETPREFLAELKRAGVKVRVFHRWSWRDPWRYNRRNHCKLLLLDERQVYLGGFNIHDASSMERMGEKRWRDTHVRLNSAEMARQAAQVFLVFWTRRVPRALRHGKPLDLFNSDTLVTNRIPRHRHALRTLFYQGLYRAKEHVRIATPYFAPDRRTRHNLMRAAERGVDVTLLLPAVSDNRLVQMAARFIYDRLLHAGIRIFEYQPRKMHAKTIAVDGVWASIGSANLDYRSLFHNYEINYTTIKPEVCEELERQFAEDLEQSEEITLDSLRHYGWWERLGGRLGWRLRWWL
ncbi:MAG: phosphatidylserine/phosphatidylglycerophosphate/cardiolipin synthase family protein [Ectothiorhodospiraceae bacterium]|nr:phosphatidylserine/phosphatidylglycerophosphate/cardiolipin synthase family protein [Ectothiorhodospiraceae bacterium]